MPINIPDNLPAVDILARENIFTMRQSRAIHQDIRALQIIILNLMPKKIDTETGKVSGGYSGHILIPSHMHGKLIEALKSNNFQEYKPRKTPE